MDLPGHHTGKVITPPTSTAGSIFLSLLPLCFPLLSCCHSFCSLFFTLFSPSISSFNELKARAPHYSLLASLFSSQVEPFQIYRSNFPRCNITVGLAAAQIAFILKEEQGGDASGAGAQIKTENCCYLNIHYTWEYCGPSVSSWSQASCYW